MTQSNFSEIMILVDNLFNVIEIENEFWLVQNFVVATENGKLSNIDYNSFSGICITEILQSKKIQTLDRPTQLAFLQQINAFIENKVYIRVKFSKYARYFYYTKN